jgi:hypothetical protein
MVKKLLDKRVREKRLSKRRKISIRIDLDTGKQWVVIEHSNGIVTRRKLKLF